MLLDGWRRSDRLARRARVPRARAAAAPVTMRAVVVALVVAPAIAAAHVHLTFPTSRTDSLLGDQKEQHCGVATYVRADHPERTSTFPPGATITVTWME